MPEDIHWQKYSSRFRTFPAILEMDQIRPGLVVCIPVYAEPDLIKTLDSLFQCDLPDTLVEVMLLFNMSNRMTEEEIAQHALTWENTISWIEHHKKEGLHYHAFHVDEFPDPKGGVGWARKRVMDEAARRLHQHGVLLCLDADCTVAANYLQTVYTYFLEHPDCDAASLNFEHNPGIEDRRLLEAITQYELHLRYLVAAMRWAGHPFAFHTVGSSMAVRRGAYLAQGGMNTRQAGEDFYFLQKFIEIGSLHEINQTTVYPSSRISARVPFGTGRAMQTLLTSFDEWNTTDFTVFRLIQPLFTAADTIRKHSLDTGIHDNDNFPFEALGLHEWVIHFLKHIGFSAQCRQIAAQTSGAISFRRRFFRYFNSFMMIRYMHYISEHFIPEKPIVPAAIDLLSEINGINEMPKDSRQLLEYFRLIQRTKPAFNQT